ncbi:MAG: ABC transporter substrate-binding protein [Chloroflexales bacterium]|nr:ABC transporter substrate-binding protein [Chloroflexales bacterium]
MSLMRVIGFVLVAVLLLPACGSSTTPPAPTPFIPPPPPDESCILQSGATVSFPVNGTFPSDATYKWEAQSGTFNPEDGAVTNYTAGTFTTDQPVTITVSVTSNGSTTRYFLSCQVKADPNAVAVATTSAVAQEAASPTTDASPAPPSATPTQASVTPPPGPTNTPGAAALPAPLPLTPSSASEPAPDDMLIALVSTFTSDPPLRGLDIFRAGQLIGQDSLWAQQLAPLGKTVWIVAWDDKGDPAEGEQIARKLVADPRYIAVVGHNLSGVLERALPIYNEAKLPVISVAATAKGLTTGPANSNNVLTRVVGRDDVQGKVAADYIRDEIAGELAGQLQGSPPRVYVVHDSSAYGVGLKDQFTAQAAGLKLVGARAYDQATVREIVNLVLLEAADVVFFPGYDDQMAAFLVAMAEAYAARPELKRPIILGTDGTDTPDLAAGAGQAAIGVRYTTVYMSERDLKAREGDQSLPSLADLYKGRFGDAPASLLGESSDGMLLCLTALGRAAADGKVDREELRASIRAFPASAPFKGRTGNYTFTSQGDPSESFYYVRRVASALPGDWDENETLKFVSVKPPQP